METAAGVDELDVAAVAAADVCDGATADGWVGAAADDADGTAVLDVMVQLLMMLILSVRCVDWSWS